MLPNKSENFDSPPTKKQKFKIVESCLPDMHIVKVHFASYFIYSYVFQVISKIIQHGKNFTCIFRGIFVWRKKTNLVTNLYLFLCFPERQRQESKF